MKRKNHTKYRLFMQWGVRWICLVDGQKVARINHQETVELNLNSDNRLSVRFSILKSKEIALPDLRRNSIRNKNESATDFFLCAVFILVCF